MREKNNKQDIEIAKLSVKQDSFKERFDRFIDNEFNHLRKRVDWILWYLVLGSLIAILIKIAF